MMRNQLAAYDSPPRTMVLTMPWAEAAAARARERTAALFIVVVGKMLRFGDKLNSSDMKSGLAQQEDVLLHEKEWCFERKLKECDAQRPTRWPATG